ncbi:hypothetical protein L873DRAFT_1845349 [Choiromyces venosus 120613-1]|uniref:Uncharacterized protein n=1 Tax=Choiromyces venosus 120613-1 TaxID=1336337 RepID=A0A3N4JE90_9PEZI|nr:hypothetical protein L873DRAFT_1845349 [Choiromyces venosus 120613-1]
MRPTTPRYLSLLLICTLLFLIPSANATLPDTISKLAKDMQTWVDKTNAWTNASSPTPCKAFVHEFIGPGKRVGITSNWITRIAIDSPRLDRAQSSRVILEGMFPLIFSHLQFKHRVSEKTSLIKSCPGAAQEALEVIAGDAEAMSQTFAEVESKVYEIDGFWVYIIGREIAKIYREVLEALM